MNSPTPAIVTQAAVQRLPRWALWLFCLAYVLPGFLGRTPWKDHDMASFGAMQALADGRSSWWQPTVAGLPVETPGWLAYWLGALAMDALPWLDPALSSRLPFVGLLGLTLACTWYATYHLARLPAAQPVAFAFGGEARPIDYARAMADAALLALIACLGLAQLSHETTPDLARLACWSLLMLAAARQTADPGEALTNTGLFVGGLCGLYLSGHGGGTFALGLGWLAITLQSGRDHPQRRHTGGLWLVLSLVLGLLAWRLGLLAGHVPHLPPDAAEWHRWLRLLVWFNWPAWPLALWTLWRWRRQLGSPHVALPLWGLLLGLLGSAMAENRDRALLPVLPAFAVLAAFALPTLRRSVSALIDWFTLLFFSACALIIWVFWLAMQTGVPTKAAANVARLAPGFVAEFELLPTLLAVAATVGWLWLVAWRTGAHRQAIWKSLVLPAAGTTLCWLLLMTHWLPLLDFGRSYGPLARSIARQVPSEACVLTDGLTQSQISALIHHGKLQVKPLALHHNAPCPTLVVSPEAQQTLDQRTPLTDWAYTARVARVDNRSESLLVYQRVGP